MKLLKYYPGQRISLNELKWQQQEYCNAINDIYSILNPKFFSSSGHGLMLHSDSSKWNDSEFPYLFYGTDSTTTITIGINNPYMHGSTFGKESFGDVFQFASMMFSDETETSGNASFDWTNNLINTGETSATDGWLNFFFWPVYYGYSEAVEVNKYLDSVVANRGSLDSSNSQTTYTADGQQIIPYLLDGPIDTNEADRNISDFIRVYKSSSVFGANDFTTNFTYWSIQDHHGSNASAITIPHRQLVTYLYSIYWNATTKTYSSGGYYRVIFQPIVAADMISYDTRLETIETTFASTLQRAFGRLMDVFAAYSTALSSTDAFVVSGAYDDAVFITETAQTLLSGYTENSKFPTGIGIRYDS